MLAVITGISGMDGSHMADILIKDGYDVVGLVRRAAVPRYDNINHLIGNPKFNIVEGDLLDPTSVRQIINKYKPDVIYNFAAQSHVQTSFNQPSLTFNVNTLGILNILESVRECSPNSRVYQASTSEMFGQNYKLDEQGRKYQDDTTEFAPRSPYGISKLAAHHLIKVYRESYGLFTCAGILFNHEGPRRGHLFVTRKITRWLAKFWHNKRLTLNDSEKLRLGNLHAHRDWGHAVDFCTAIYKMMNQNEPDDYVVATGVTRTIEDLLTIGFKVLPGNLKYQDYVIVDPAFFRPNEVDYLCGHADKAREKLGWKPNISFEDMIIEMVENDIKLYERQK